MANSVDLCSILVMCVRGEFYLLSRDGLYCSVLVFSISICFVVGISTGVITSDWSCSCYKVVNEFLLVIG